MLINEPSVNYVDPVLQMLSSVIGNSSETKQLTEGVYQIGHFGSSDFLCKGYEQYPDLGEHGSYGVCDGLENMMAVMGDVLNDPQRKFVVTLTPVHRDPSNKGRGGGWRWHKWGEYIGAFDPQCKYLDDEEGIDTVYCYHVYEKLN